MQLKLRSEAENMIHTLRGAAVCFCGSLKAHYGHPRSPEEPHILHGVLVGQASFGKLLRFVKITARLMRYTGRVPLCTRSERGVDDGVRLAQDDGNGAG